MQIVWQYLIVFKAVNIKFHSSFREIFLRDSSNREKHVCGKFAQIYNI